MIFIVIACILVLVIVIVLIVKYAKRDPPEVRAAKASAQAAEYNLKTARQQAKQGRRASKWRG
jgi:Na+-transporting methylmalonyl-CoA/oxaloacetate decarboxylase gamma subunit